MDTIQAAVLNVKLKHYLKDLALRQGVAKKYNSTFNIQHSTFVLPFIEEGRTSAWAQYSVRVKNRDQLQVKLKEQGVPTAVHYPMPLHLQECFAYLGHQENDFAVAEQVSREIMSLPMNPYLSDEEITYICKQL